MQAQKKTGGVGYTSNSALHIAAAGFYAIFFVALATMMLVFSIFFYAFLIRHRFMALPFQKYRHFLLPPGRTTRPARTCQLNNEPKRTTFSINYIQKKAKLVFHSILLRQGFLLRQPSFSKATEGCSLPLLRKRTKKNGSIREGLDPKFIRWASLPHHSARWRRPLSRTIDGRKSSSHTKAVRVQTIW